MVAGFPLHFSLQNVLIVQSFVRLNEPCAIAIEARALGERERNDGGHDADDDLCAHARVEFEWDSCLGRAHTRTRSFVERNRASESASGSSRYRTAHHVER